MRFAALIALFGCALAQAQSADTHQHDFRDAGKWAQVFDDPKRDEWQKPQEVIKALELAQDSTVADIGAGTGYFSVRLAQIVPNGRVYAVDVETEMVKHLALRAANQGLANVIAVRGAPDDPRLPGKVDVALLVDTYHHIEDREAYFTRLRGMLKPGGRIVVIDFKPDAPQGPPKATRLSADAVKAELDRAGFLVSDDFDFLPYQYFLIFR
ncbi:MAG TPA: class I SAM-dependent methyltransferase [Burkholderiales bacterium]